MKTPTEGKPEEFDVIIQVSRHDADLNSFLSSAGVRARPHYGVFNGPMGDVQEMLKHPAPYVWATASASALIAAFQAYAKTRQRRITIRKMKTGVSIDATNFSPKELKDLGVLDLVEFERIDDGDKKT